MLKGQSRALYTRIII